MSDQPEPEPSFENALTQLERIVAGLERGESELTAALANYEKGVGLLNVCYRLLDQAEQSVALLTGVNEQGIPFTKPFDATATIAQEDGSTMIVTAKPGANDLEPKTSARFSPARNRGASRPGLGETDDPPF